MLTLTDVLEALIGIRPEGMGRIITGAVVDSREAIPGSVFGALEGEHTDGHDYVQDPFDHGATLALVEKDLSAQFLQLDLRAGRQAESLANIGETPFCIRVTNSLLALQQIARDRRQRMDLRVVGITGSVGKSTTKELVAQVLSQ